MNNGGQQTTKGILAQNFAALSLFLQFLRDPNFLHIHLEAPKFQDFNLIFNNKKIICESRYRERNFSYVDLKKILNKLIKEKIVVGDNDEILIICRKITDDFITQVQNARFFEGLKKKFVSKGYSEQEISLLGKVKFWHINEEMFGQEEIIYELFNDLINFWMPTEELKQFVDSYFLKEILKKSSKGAVITRQYVLDKINNYTSSISKKLGSEREKKDEKYEKLLNAIENNRITEMPDWHKMDFSTRNDEMAFVLDKIKKNDFKIDDLSKWSKLWDLVDVHPFSFGVFDVFENNLHNKKNREYIIGFINKNLGKMRGYYNVNFFKTDVIKILNKIIKYKDKSYLEKSFSIIKGLLKDHQTDFLYIKDRDDVDYKKKEVCKFLGKVYGLADNNLKNKVYQLITEIFNLMGDDGKFEHYTPNEIFRIIKEHITLDDKFFKERFVEFVNIIIEQYQVRYDNKFSGWEWSGGGICQSGNHFSISDRHFIIFVLKPAVNEYYKKNPKKTWRNIFKNFVTRTDKVSDERPDFLNRACLDVVLEEYKKGNNSALDILKEFILSKKGIPRKTDLIYQVISTGKFTDKQKWELVKISLDKHKIPINVFVEKIVRDLVKNNFEEAKQEIINWMMSKKYFERFRSEIQAIQNISIFINIDYKFALKLFSQFINNPIFIDKYEYFESYDVANLLHNIMEKEWQETKNIKETAKIVNSLLQNKKKLSHNQQIVACFSFFSHRGNDDVDDRELLFLSYNKIVKPFLNKYKGSNKKKAGEIAKFITKSNPREAFVQFASRLAQKKEIEKTLKIIEVFVNDPNPYLPNKDPEDKQNKYNEHKNTENGKKPDAIVSVRGWCGWTLGGCSILVGRKYIDKVIKLTKQLLGDKNYYVKHMACFSLERLMQNRLTVISEQKKDILFLDPTFRESGKTTKKDKILALKKSKEVECLAFNILEEISKKSVNIKKSLMSSILRPFDYFRTMNQKQVEKFFELIMKFPPEAIAESVPLLIYFAELRENHYKRWRWSVKGLYDDLFPFDSKIFKKEIKNLIQRNNEFINRKFSFHFYQLVKSAPEKPVPGNEFDYEKSFNMAYSYIKIIAKKYCHELYIHIYMFIEENMNKKNKECTELLIDCYKKEKAVLDKKVKAGNSKEVFWWADHRNGDILVKIKDNKKFLEAFSILASYPKGVSNGQLLSAISRLEKFPKTNKRVLDIFNNLSDRNINFTANKKRWQKK